MPTQQITTHVTGQRAKALVDAVVSAFDQVRDAEASVEDARREAIRARFRWGREVYDALSDAEYGESVAEEVGRRIDRSAAWVRQHARFANAVTETWSHKYDPAIAGYIADCMDRDRSLSWRSAVQWMSDGESSDDNDDHTADVERLRRDVERKLEALEETAEDLAETFLDTGDTLDDGERRAVEGVLTRAQQAIEDNAHLAEQLEEAAPERVECETYRRWLAKSGVCDVCGLMDDTIVAHHPEHVYPERGGTATKMSDFLCVRLCHTCHREVEEADERTWWKKQDKNPKALAAEHQARWNAKLTQHHA